MRLECLSTSDAYRKVGYSPSNRALRETRMASSRNDPEVGIGSRYTLYSVIRGGIGLTMRLECPGTSDAYRKVGYSPSNRALRETRMASSRNDPEVGIGSRYTLKLLVVSVSPDRSVLLSSRCLMQWPQFCAPESGAPSAAPSRRPANSYRTLPPDFFTHLTGWVA